MALIFAILVFTLLDPGTESRQSALGLGAAALCHQLASVSRVASRGRDAWPRRAELRRYSRGLGLALRHRLLAGSIQRTESLWF